MTGSSPAALIRVALAALLPGGLIVGLAVNSGGFGPASTAIAVLVVGAALLLHVFTTRPGQRATSGPAAVALLAFAAFAGWSLLSALWSHAPARATLEFDRTLLYLGLLAVFARIGRDRAISGWLALGLGLALAATSVAALAVYLLPESFPVGSEFARARLSWPTSYWNTSGLIGAMCLIAGAHASTLIERPAAVRVAGAAAVPVGVAVIYFSLSRGALLVAVAGLLTLLVLGRSRGSISGLLATVAGAAGAYVVSAGATGLTAERLDAAGLASGQRTAILLAAVMLVSALLRAVLGLLDRRLAGRDAPKPRLAPRRAFGSIVLLLAVGSFFALGGPDRASRAWDEFTSDAGVPSSGSPTDRFTSLGNNNRLPHYRVALRDGFEPHPIKGTGVGTFAVVWAANRPNNENVLDVHSLYLEVLAELGIVGLTLLLTALGSIFVALVRRSRQEADVWPLFTALAVGWGIGAGFDWYWEMPAVTSWLFAVGGLALSRPTSPEVHPEAIPARSRKSTSPLTLLVFVIGVAVLAVTPVKVYRSQTALTDAVQAFRTGDCQRTTERALDAADAMSSRPEPLELLGYCNVRAGRTVLAQRALEAATRRDPDNWEFYYDLALARAVGGRDPRPAARAAVLRNPRDSRPRTAYQAFTQSPRRRWRRIALAAPTLVPPRR